MHFSHLRGDGRAVFHFADPNAQSVFVTGSFADWRAPGVPLTRGQAGWEAVVEVPHGELAYKLIVDGRWLQDPKNLDSVPDGNGGKNSILRRSEQRGSSVHLRFVSPALGEERGYAVLLPPEYFTSDWRFPVLYLLHGALDWERTWLERGELAGTLEALHREGLRAPIVVMPNEAGDLYRGDGRVSDYLARDLVGHVDFEFRTLAQPRGRAIDGLSTGGFTSLVVGAWRPDVFGSVGSMSGSYNGRAFEAVRTSAPTMRAAGQRLLLSCGHDEPHFRDCRAMFETLERLGLPSRWVDAPGSHDWPVWRALLGAHLRFHCEGFAG
ncbi:MAG: hypothetical protein IPM79_13500 [Polyangiaceae bacterium]|nr:hypothetical protein [Polyangiaceae bacterium]MBK8938613.1 hypothetical protein [Polyangiaceae bacterium]